MTESDSLAERFEESRGSAWQTAIAGRTVVLPAEQEGICDNLLTVCGRYRLSRRKQLVEEYFDTASWEDNWNPRFNIAPTQSIPVIRQNPKKLSHAVDQSALKAD